MIKKEDRIYFETLFPFWEKLSQQEKNYFIINSRTMTFTKGVDISSSPECFGLTIIKSGRIRVFLSSKEGKELSLFFLKAMDIGVLTAQCIHPKLQVSINLHTEEATEVIVMNPEAFSLMRKRNSEVSDFNMDLIYARFSEIIEQMETALFVPLNTRLIRFLLKQEKQEILMTQEEIARHLGSAREVITRNLKLLQSAGCLQVSRGKIQILSEKNLQSMID
ncbi:Crp/Fnr family transcriptional regulator [Fusobacterium necrophorum subsp. funduliforme]|uniref:Crp/Fnr family transcriptional regulator n=1 Tax=Fusobacterium necrophorum TaxID=859 RepID=UPI000245E113|nr:Crp/Fnr family transcriptional regulator [Fusobacterium necrophorum]AVQ21665.1 Crp/Fnr family transcriptional regulator [Fusobacterium necrophorum subsp. funduliforme]EHO19287.1 hypothetical protein HMPREF9466_01218 [Fusobacterium necrophorum subsp. funduliforme 1_1_36S]